MESQIEKSMEHEMETVVSMLSTTGIYYSHDSPLFSYASIVLSAIFSVKTEALTQKECPLAIPANHLPRPNLVTVRAWYAGYGGVFVGCCQGT